MHTLTPLIAVHASAAIAATVIGPFALWARLGLRQRPRLHRALGYAWVTLMIVTAVSAIFIRNGSLALVAGFSPIHLLIPVVLFGLFGAFWFLFRGNVNAHRKTMVRLYIGSCVIAGIFTLLPGRLLGHWLWTTVGVLA